MSSVIDVTKIPAAVIVASLASAASVTNSVSRDTVVLAFHLNKFLKTDHSYTNLINEPTRELISKLVTNNFRPPLISLGRIAAILSSARDSRARARSQSVELPVFPTDWALDRASLRIALATFYSGTQNLQRLLYNPPSTGNIPPRSPTTNPIAIESTTSNDGHTIRATSADEAIFNQPIGPENRRPSNEIPPDNTNNWQNTGFT